MSRKGFLYFFILLFFGMPIGSSKEDNPKVWIFCSTPGSEEFHRFFESTLGSMRTTLTRSYGLNDEDITILYGPKTAGYSDRCTRENLLAELKKIVEYGESDGATPVWVFFLGHANRIPGDTYYNLSGPDVLVSEIANALKAYPKENPLVVVASNSCSAEFFKNLTGPGRVVFSAASDGDPITSTEFEKMVPKVLSDPNTDANGDHFISAEEIFRACQRGVLLVHEEKKFLLRENSQFDGNGDGVGTRRPSREDAEPASTLGFHLNPLTKFQ